MVVIGDVVRQLMERKGVRGVQLAQDIGITATSVSCLLNGISKPRQLTLTRIMQHLCATPQEEQLILSAFAGTKDSAKRRDENRLRYVGPAKGGHWKVIEKGDNG